MVTCNGNVFTLNHFRTAGPMALLDCALRLGGN